MEDAAFEDVLSTVRRFVREQVVPLEAEIDERDEAPERLRASARDMGLFGFAIPEQYGGLGPSVLEENRLVMELGYTTPSSPAVCWGTAARG